MDTVGTVEMYNSLKKYNILTCFHKFMDVNNTPPIIIEINMQFLSVSEIEDHDKLQLLYGAYPCKCNIICIDVANGYMQN